MGAAVSLQAIKGAAAGTFLYIALVEILARELKHDDHESGGGHGDGSGGGHGDGSTDTELARSARLFLFVMGFGLMSSLAIWV